ncbi:PadR family transcriptional regulator [Streptomyces monomycini]|uniref:PadR family transcriptional regulator n=1 Tax=Streptomyces monomycini TaxID=371720 RepID=UPI0004AA0752|nr:PadR family transcriptional regulator [Streptomyces monomycini]
MPPVFAHGRLRLYLLKLLDEAPRHGYEIIRLLEERFQGLYAPSAGTVYPRLAKLAAEGLVTHTTEGGRKVYAITAAGRAELADRGGELADLELEIRESVAALASDIREDVSGSARNLRREMREAAQQAREGRRGASEGGGAEHGFPDAAEYFEDRFGDKEGWRQAKEEFRRAKEEWKEQARRAKEESRRAKQDAQRARKQARDAQSFVRDEVQQAIKRVQEQAQEHVRTGDWAGALREALSEVSREMGRFGAGPGPAEGGPAGADHSGGARGQRPADAADAGLTEEDATAGAGGTDDSRTARTARTARTETGDPAVAEPAWASEPGSGDPARDFDRLLDRFRDDLRDAARDHGVSAEQLKDVRSRLSSTAAHVGALLRDPEAYAAGQEPPH